MLEESDVVPCKIVEGSRPVEPIKPIDSESELDSEVAELEDVSAADVDVAGVLEGVLEGVLVVEVVVGAVESGTESDKSCGSRPVDEALVSVSE